MVDRYPSEWMHAAIAPHFQFTTRTAATPPFVSELRDDDKALDPRPPLVSGVLRHHHRWGPCRSYRDGAVRRRGAQGAYEDSFTASLHSIGGLQAVCFVGLRSACAYSTTKQTVYAYSSEAMGSSFGETLRRLRAELSSSAELLLSPRAHPGFHRRWRTSRRCARARRASDTRTVPSTGACV